MNLASCRGKRPRPHGAAQKNGAVPCRVFELPAEMERCVLCGRITDVPCALPVDCRTGYVSAAGQLCPDCCRALEQEKAESAVFGEGPKPCRSNDAG